jgi:hypothetical protein
MMQFLLLVSFSPWKMPAQQQGVATTLAETSNDLLLLRFWFILLLTSHDAIPPPCFFQDLEHMECAGTRRAADGSCNDGGIIDAKLSLKGYVECK